MVIGFVNAGLMDLYQALWIIMGANIGTNITSQLIAFKIGDYAAILALIGVLMCLIVKNKKMRGISEVVAALGFIFVSMNLMTSSMDRLSELDIVKDMFINLKNPILESSRALPAVSVSCRHSLCPLQVLTSSLSSRQCSSSSVLTSAHVCMR